MLGNYKSLEYVQDIDWKDIFAVWRVYESYQESWERHWKDRGFDSWDEWRKNYIAPINPEDKNWKIYRIKDFSEVLNFWGVPSRAWIEKCYDGKITKRIEDILDQDIVRNNIKVESIINNFPYQTMLTGIMSEGKIVLVEGMHRVLALAVMTKNGQKIEADVIIALAEHEGEIPKLGKGNLKY